MHIPDHMVANSVCTLANAVTLGAGILVVRQAMKTTEKPKAETFAAVTALVFALQMLNFPISGGTSGHILGGTLAAGWLGTVWGMLSIALVVAIQALVFGDGGLMALGANVLIMAVIGAGIGGMLRERLMRVGPRMLATSLASWGSVMAAAFVCSVVLALGTPAGFMDAALPMLGVHALIGIGEAVITTALSEAREKNVRLYLPLSLAVIAVCMSPLASGLPDGLEFVAHSLNIHIGDGFFAAPLPDYGIPGMSGALSGILAGMTGLLICFATGHMLALYTESA